MGGPGGAEERREEQYWNIAKRRGCVTSNRTSNKIPNDMSPRVVWQRPTERTLRKKQGRMDVSKVRTSRRKL